LHADFFNTSDMIKIRQGARFPRRLAKRLMEKVVPSSCPLTCWKLHYILGDNYILEKIESSHRWYSAAVYIDIYGCHREVHKTSRLVWCGTEVYIFIIIISANNIYINAGTKKWVSCTGGCVVLITKKRPCTEFNKVAAKSHAKKRPKRDMSLQTLETFEEHIWFSGSMRRLR
jgi:hypothetical protein